MKATRRQVSRKWLLMLFLTGTLSWTVLSCSKDNRSDQTRESKAIADRVWEFSQDHPDGFTLDIRTWTEPSEGIAVSYAATQNSHSRESLEKVVTHALAHEGYVGGWLDIETGLYYFDSTRLFPEDSLDAAIQFGKANGQLSVYILSSGLDIPLDD